MFDFPRHFAARVARFERECARIERSGRGPEGCVFLGDSFVECYEGRIPWVNRGISGDRLHGPEVDVFERLGGGRLHPSPQAIVTLIGHNDVAHAPDAVARHVEAYRHLLANLARIHPNARLGVLSLLPTRAAKRHLNPSIGRLNEELALVASSHGAVFWDLHARMLDPRTGEARQALIQDDGAHLTRRGYAELTAFVEEHARELRIETPTGAPDTAALRKPDLSARLARAWEIVGPSLGASPSRGTDDGTRLFDRWALGARIVARYGREAWVHRPPTPSDREIVSWYVLPEIDFLCRYAMDGSPLFRDLYLGARASFFAQNERLWSAQGEGLRGALDEDRALWLDSIGASLAAPLRRRFEEVFAELRAAVPAGAPKNVRLLFVGDCLLEDVELILGGQLLRQGILAKVAFILSKNPVEQAREIRALREEAFDGVVYSPLSWEFDPEFRSFFEPALRSRRALNDSLEAIWKRAASTLKLLAHTFESPIYVHNTAAAVRASDEVRRTIRALLTYPQRDFARRELSHRIGALLSEINRSSFQHLFLVDELSAVHDLHDDLTLGRVLYYAAAIHPAVLSCEVSRQLSGYVMAAARFAGKKVVVCDLDNTLWDGVIGEGDGVRHQRRRQQILKALKQKGVVLAINSKNDPASVRWDGGILQADDFVASEISWGAKAAAMKRIQESLNLKIKDFVFIDDRSDERAMMKQEFPAVEVLDPGAEQTWTIFEAWAKLLGDDEGDRTRLYRERAEREKRVAGDEAEADQAEMFRKLELRVDIRRSSPGDLKRIHELINRTNQWNLQGTRCTFNEVVSWHESEDHLVYAVRVSDRFGDMGLISCCVAELDDQALSIPVFVLSCRVFGYGVETLLLEQVKKDAAARFGAPSVRGKYVENAHNRPCRSMYETHGFSLVDGVWVHPGGRSTAPDPVWFRSS